MNRNKGIFSVILGILVCGILITSFTASLLKKQERDLASAPDPAYGIEEAAQARFYGGGDLSQDGAGSQEETKAKEAQLPEEEDPGEEAQMDLGPGEAETEENTSGRTAGSADSEAEESETETDGGSQPQAVSSRMTDQAPAAAAFSLEEVPGTDAGQAESQSVEESIAADDEAGPGVMLSEGVAGTEEGTGKKTAADFRRRLEEIDGQIEDQRSRSDAYTTYDMWAMAENERKLWDGELNNIYTTIKDHIPADQVEALVKDERAWIVERDAKAAADAGKYEGGTLESVEYTASLASSTRERAYKLVEIYGEYLW